MTQEHVEQLKDCYEAVLVRRVERGVGSIRTRSGYSQLRTKYQARLRFLQDPTLLSAQAPQPGETSSLVEAAVPLEADTGDQHESAELQTEEERLRSVVGAYFDQRIKRLISDICWPMAHFGGSDAPLGSIPEWQELEQDKYFAFMYKALLWLFPGLPGVEAQLQAEKDWQKDIEFDVYGTYGLSYEGFSVSLLDLATSCTDGSGDKCLEFLQLLTKRLQEALPIFRVPTSTNLLAADDSSATKPTRDKIKWHEIPLETLVPFSIQQKARYYELRTKLSTAPLVIMLLPNSEKMIELQLSTSIKLLVRERESRTSVRRQTLGMRSHFIELEKQLLWTFRDVGSHSSVLLIPSEFISRRSMALYACIRLMDSYEQELHANAREGQHPEQASRRLSQTPTMRSSISSTPALLTLYTSVQDPVVLLNSTHESVCGRIDRNGSRLFVIDHRNQTSDFSITFKTSLIQNTSAGGGAGAAATLSTAVTSSLFICPPASPGAEAPAAHSYMFVVKCQDNMTEMMTSAYGNSAKTHDSKLAPQWFTTISGANEVKTVLVSKARSHKSNNDPISDVQVTSSAREELSTSGIYYVTMVSIHGIYYDAFWEDLPPGFETTDEVEASPGSTMPPAEPDPVTSQHDIEQSSIESDDLRSLQYSSDSMKSSANILRRILLLRKKRQAAEPPPEFIPGANVFSNKTLTAAATLRAKFLRARALERHTRLVQHEDALRSKVLAKLLRSQARFGSSRQKLFRPVEESRTDEYSKTAELEARVNLLTHFFREMAMHQPTHQELKLEESSLDAEGHQQDELLDHFGDLFGNDIALQNLLDQEKWMSAEEKIKRRAALLEERLNLKGSVKETKEEAKFCSEDYEATVGFIERLMCEVEEERVEEKPNTDAEFKGMVASWIYSNERSRSSGLFKQEQQATIFNNLEAQRREKWMQSKHIQSLADKEDHCNQAHQQNPLKSPLITNKQYLHEQTQNLPWQAVWESCDPQGQRVDLQTANTTPDTSAVNTPTNQPTTKPYDFRPRPPIERPKTARTSDQVASQSARFVSANTKRIRSARTGYVRRQFAQPLHEHTEATGNTTSSPSNAILHLPLAFIRNIDREPERDSREEISAEERDYSISCDEASDYRRIAAEKEFNAVSVAKNPSQTTQIPTCEEDSLLSMLSSDSQNLADTQVAITQTRTRGKGRSKKSLNSKQRTDKLFARRVQELICIANIVKIYEQTSDEDAI